MGVKKALEWVGEKFSGGAAGAAAGDLKGRGKRIDREVEGAAPPAKAASEPKPEKEIRFAKGGMVRRGYGKARGC